MRVVQSDRLPYSVDFCETAVFDLVSRLKKTDNLLLLCSPSNYAEAKEIIQKHQELNMRAICLPSNLPNNSEDAFALVDLNDLRAVYSAGC